MVVTGGSGENTVYNGLFLRFFYVIYSSLVETD